MMQSIQHLQPYEGHRIGLLRNRRDNPVLLNPIQRFRIGIHGHHNLAALHVGAVHHFGHFFPGLRFQAHERLHVIFSLAQHGFRLVESNARIALNINLLRDLDARTRQRIFVAAQPVLQIRLARHREHNHVALTFQFLGQPFSANHPHLIVIGADKKQSLAGWRIRVHRDHRNPRRYRAVDAVLQQSGIGHCQQDSTRLLLDGFIQCFSFRFRIISIRAGLGHLHLQLFSSFLKS